MSYPNINWPSKTEFCTDPEIIRNKFNQSQLLEKRARGEVKTTVHWSQHRSPRTEPRCTKSQIIIYWEDDRAVAMAHRYLRPDGTLGARGIPDPKWIIVGDTITILRASN